MVPFDEDKADDGFEEISDRTNWEKLLDRGLELNRRQFLGTAAAGATVATGAFAQTDERDDLDLEFVWGSDEAGRYLEVVALVGVRREARGKDAVRDQVQGREILWRLRPEMFGPEVAIAYKRGTTDGYLTHSLRLTGVSFGRAQRRTLRLHFYRVPQASSRATPVYRFKVALNDGIWSKAKNTLTPHFFTLESRHRTVPAGTPRAGEDLRAFASGQARLYQSTTAKSVTNTCKLMFNGLLGLAPGQAGRHVWVSIDHQGTWRVAPVQDSKHAPFRALGGRESIQRIEVYWSRSQTRKGTNKAAAETPLLGICHPATAEGPSSYRIQAQGGPGLTLQRDKGDEPRRVLMRMQPAKGRDGAATGQIRAEAVLSGRWSDVTFTGTGTETGPFPALAGAMLERVDAPAKETALDYAARKGSLSFMGVYRTGNGNGNGNGNGRGEVQKLAEASARSATRMGSAIGRLTVTAVVPADQEKFEKRLAGFPSRAGWPFSALYSWDRRVAGSSGRPVARSVDARVALIEAGVRVEDADFSRLSFEPAELRVFHDDRPLPASPLGNSLNLSPAPSEDIARLDLSRATLRASRTHDLVSLKFRFSDLALSFRDGQTEILRANANCDLGTRADASGRMQPHDTRPVIVVEYPGQHLFEEARFLPNPPPMPDIKLPLRLTVVLATGQVVHAPYEKDPAFPGQIVDKPAFSLSADGKTIVLDAENRRHVVEALDLLSPDTRVLMRRRLRSLKGKRLPALEQGQDPGAHAAAARKRKIFRDFADAVEPKLQGLVDRRKLPEAQLHYIGPFAMDADAMQLLRRHHEGDFVELLRAVRDDMFAAVNGYRGPDPKTLDSALAQERRLESAVPTYQLFRTFYREVMIASYFDGQASGFRAAESLEAEEIEFFEANRRTGPVWVPQAKRRVLKDRADILADKFLRELRGAEDSSGPVRGRLARPSRLAFRVNCRDSLDAARTAHADLLDLDEDAGLRQPRRALAFTLADLTNFKDFELAVTTRAEIVYDGGRLGLIDTRHSRVPDRRPGAMLDRLGFSTGPGVTAAQRLAEVAASLRAPTPLETAIEIPARLTLSPHQDAIVLAPSGNVPAIFDGAEGKDSAFVPPSRLWVTSFLTAKNEAGMDPGLRAVHSPDLRPEALLHRMADLKGGGRSPGNAAPPRGPLAPWFLSRMETQRATMTGPEAIARFAEVIGDTDRPNCQLLLDNPDLRKRYPGIVAELCRAFGRKDPIQGLGTRFRAPLDAYMRHELVLLSSAWGLPVVGAQNLDGSYKPSSGQFEPEQRHQLADVMPGSAIYRPQTLDASEVGLSSLGGILRHDSGFEPPAGALFWLDQSTLFDALSIERWQQWTNLGRDIHTEVVFKGYLFPLGVRASLVQVTERTFLIEEATGAITATLRQRMFIRVANPERSYPGIKEPYGGRRFPVKALKLLTTTTPDIVDPQSPTRGSVARAQVQPNGRIDTPNATGLAFWPRFLKAPEGNIRFEMELDDTKTELPLVFVDNTAVNDPDTLAELVTYYNDANGGWDGVPSPDARSVRTAVDPIRHLRTMALRGAKRSYAPELEKGTAAYPTDHWTLMATGGATGFANIARGAGPSAQQTRPVLDEHLELVNRDFVFGSIRTGADQPPFYPAIETARIRVSQAERLAGRALGPTRVQFDARYLLHGFEQEDSKISQPVSATNPNEVFLAIQDQHQLDMGDKGNQSGGVYRPSGHVAALSRKKGVLTLTSRVALERPRHGPDKIFGISSLFAFDKTAVAAAQVPAAPAPASPVAAPPKPDTDALEKVRAIYKNFFGSDAKILGIVRMRDLIELIVQLSSPDEGLPQMSEAMEFAGSLAEGAEDAANTVRTQVVAPLSSGARQVRAGWDQIEETVAQAQASAGLSEGRIIRIRDVFPELDRALTDLVGALVRAEAETDPIAFGFELSACYTSGQRFLVEVQRAAANPGERIEAALSAKFADVLGLFRAAMEGREAALRIVLEALDLPDPDALGRDMVTYLVDQLPQDILRDPLGGGAVFNRRREIIALPRGAYWYRDDGGIDPDKEKGLQACLKALVPPQELAQEVIKAFTAYTAVRIFRGQTLPEPEILMRDFLAFEPRRNRRCRRHSFDDFLRCTELEHVRVELEKDAIDPDTAGTQAIALLEAIEAKALDKANGWSFASDAHKAEITRVFAELKRKLRAHVTEGANAANLKLKSGTIAEQIRNQYLLCVLKEFPVGEKPDIPLSMPEMMEFRRDLLEFLRRLFEPSDDLIPDFLPDLSKLFDPLKRLLEPLERLRFAIEEPDLNEFLKALGDLLRKLGVPIPRPSIPNDLPDFKDVFCPTWEVARTVMGTLGQEAQSGALCPLDATVPACPIWIDATQNVYAALNDDTTELGKMIAAAEPSVCTLTLRFGMSAHALHQVLGADVRTKLAALNAKLASMAAGNAQIADIHRRTQRLDGEMDAAQQCLDRLRVRSADLYCALETDTRRLRSLSRDLTAASKIDFCAIGSIGELQKEFDRIQSLVNLPRDVEAFLDARQGVVETLNSFFTDVVGILQGKGAQANCWDGIPVATGLHAFVIGLDLMEAEGDALKVPQELEDLQSEIEDYVDALRPIADEIAQLLQSYAETACHYAQVLDEVLQLLTQLRDKMAALTQGGGYAAQIAAFLKDELNYADILAHIEAAEGHIRRVSALRDTYCKQIEGSQPPKRPLDDIGSIDDLLALSGNGGNGFTLFDGAESAAGQAARDLKGVVRNLTRVAEPIRQIAEKGPRDQALLLLDKIAGAAIGDGSTELRDLYAQLKENRDALQGNLADVPLFGDDIAEKLFVAPNAARRRIEISSGVLYDPKPGSAPKWSTDNDQLAGDVAWLGVLGNGQPINNVTAPVGPFSDSQRFAFMQAFVTEWASGEPTPVAILRNLDDLAEDVLKGEFFRAIDFNRLRDEFEEYLLSLVPTTLRMGYDFDIALGREVAAATRGIFTPGPGTALNIAMNISVDLSFKDQTAEVDFKSVGTLGPFDIKLVGDMFDALTLKFAGARFEARAGQKPRFDIEYLDYVIGPELDFLQDLQSFLAPKDGSGAFVRFDPSQPGVEAGYRLQLGDFSVGTLAFTNVGLETSAVLPFSDDEALFRASLSSRASPFTLTYAPYGGSGFFAILATPGSGIIGFEASFEFGGSAVFAFGPLSGQGRLMAGVYIRHLKMGSVKVTEISMTFFAGGSASIWIFHFAAALSVSLGMVNGNMSGSATFCFSFSMGLADFEYSVDLYKQEQKGFNGQSQASLMGPGQDRRFAFVDSASPDGPPRALRQARIKVDAVCQSKDCRTYNTYFENPSVPKGYF